MATTTGATNDLTINPSDGPLLSALAKKVSAGKCILFIGAGVHHEPSPKSSFTYPEDKRPPMAGALAHELSTECQFVRECPGERDDDLRRVALCYEQVLDRQSLAQAIKAAVDVSTEPSIALRALAALPFQLIMTTNYDTLFERALRESPRKRPTVHRYNPNRYDPTPVLDDSDMSPTTPFVFKVHGDVDDPASLVVTDEDYIDFVLRMSAEGEKNHPIPETFRYRLSLWPTLFVGYRLMDFNLRLLFRTLRWKQDSASRPSSYSVDVAPDPLVRNVLETNSKPFKFIVEDVWDFVPRLYSAVLGRELTDKEFARGPEP